MNNTRKPVYLRVYNLTKHNRILKLLGMAAYHTVVSVNGQEYLYLGGDQMGTGVTNENDEHVDNLKKEILVGYTILTEREIDTIIREMAFDFSQKKYSLIKNNCNHFTDALCRKLCNKGIPLWINRLSRFAEQFPILVPKSFKDPANKFQ